MRRDRTGKAGKVTLCYRSKLLHLGVGRRHTGARALLLVADRDVRVITDDAELIADLSLDPNKAYQAQERPGPSA